MGRLAELQRKLLEQLMGPEAMGIVQQEVSMWDAKTCRPFVAGICTHDLFGNTKMDLGTCPRSHSVKVKNEFEAEYKKAEEEKDEAMLKSLNRIRVDYEQSTFTFVDECDRRIRAAQRRLEKTPEENNRTTALMREIGELESAHQAALAEVEELGSQGKVEESMAQLAKVEALKAEKSEKERELQNLTETSGASGHQKLRVCDICGAYLSILDSDRRLADHFGGKMHLGYLQLRTLMDEWKARGPLPTGPAPPNSTAAKAASSTTESAPKVEAAAPTAFRPIPPNKTLKAFLAQNSPPPRERERDRDSRDRDSRDRRRDDYDDRDRRSSRYESDSRHSSSRRDSDRYESSSSSRRGGGESDRHESSSSRRGESDRHSSSRHGGEEEKRTSSRRGYEDGEDRDKDKDKRRRVD